MKGVEFLCNIYAASGLSIKPKTKVSKISHYSRRVLNELRKIRETLEKRALHGDDLEASHR